MCGIAVAIDWGGSAVPLVRTLLGGLLHRGDVTDPICEPRAGSALGTRRLRIVDGAHGVQPQTSSDGAVVVAFNGEIYNHAELRQELEGLGARFDTRSDTEVLANALRAWGPAALNRLEGMYAFVALEPATGEFLAARDPIGVKPLYLVRSNGGYLFGSEIRPLLETLDTGDVLFLPPGHLLTRRALKAFALPARPVPPPSAAPLDITALDRMLRQAVHRRVPPDLPFATFFSGGVDSTLVAHYARELRPEAPGYFLGSEDAPDYPYAVRYAAEVGYDLRFVPLDPERLRREDTLREIVRTVESREPDVVRNGVCTYLVAERAAADGYRVALCGEGADELFAGYAPLELAFARDAGLGWNLRMQCIESMHRTNLQRLDRCTMRFGLEMREPFLDREVVALALGLNPDILTSGAAGRPVGKQPLRQLYDLYPKQLPFFIRDRRKIGLNEGAGFDASALQSPWRDLTHDIISDIELEEGRRAFALYDVDDKEDLLYLQLLSETLDIGRVPHLKTRTRLAAPAGFAEDVLRFAEGAGVRPMAS